MVKDTAAHNDYFQKRCRREHSQLIRNGDVQTWLAR
jgi:hypothetical protein